MKSAVLAASCVLALSACALDQQYAAAINSSTVATRPDPAAKVVLQCDQLGFARWSDGHRLCVMRGIDRLAVAPSVQYAPITILPYTYPPLSPSNSVVVTPGR